MQVCCKSTGPRCSAWLDLAHLYSRVCRGSFWETGVFLAQGIDVSTAICEMHSQRAAIRDGTRRVSHPTLGSWVIVGNPRLAEWQIGQTGKSWRPRALIFLHSLLPWPLCRYWPGLRLLSLAVTHLTSTLLTSWFWGPCGGRAVDNGQWRLLKRGTVGYVHLEAAEEISLDRGFARIVRLGKMYMEKSTGLGDRFHAPNSKVNSRFKSSTITHLFVFVTR